MNSEIPRGVTGRWKLHAIHILFVGVAVVGRILERLGLCHQISVVLWAYGNLLVCRRPAPPGLHIRDLTFGGVPVRVYQPTAPSAGGRRGLLYFHGGGWVTGSIDISDEICRCIAKESETTVVSVGYRLAPEHRYPAPLDDCEVATRGFLSVAEAEFGVDPRRVAVGGDSAGANLAAALCQRLAKKQDGHLSSPCAQVLIYPVLQMADFSLPSYQQNHAVPLLFRGRAAFYYLQYLNGDVSLCQDVLEGAHVPPDLRLEYGRWLSPELLPAQFLARGCGRVEPPPYDAEAYHAVRTGLDPEMSPLLGEDEVVRRTPRAFVLTCEYDVLRDDGLLYRRRLEDLGVAVSWHHVPDGFHGLLSFYGLSWLSFPAAGPAMDSVVRFVETL
ncbi:arylacetamide deacetylase-like 4 isoform X2 [Conger conger]|nr:arylacetamide deacetylase-like 4 isoform X2 [Conger conger]